MSFKVEKFLVDQGPAGVNSQLSTRHKPATARLDYQE